MRGANLRDDGKTESRLEEVLQRVGTELETSEVFILFERQLLTM